MPPETSDGHIIILTPEQIRRLDDGDPVELEKDGTEYVLLSDVARLESVFTKPRPVPFAITNLVAGDRDERDEQKGDS